MTAVAVINLYSEWSYMAIKGGHHHKELFSLCPVKQQIFFSPYYMYSPVISTVGGYERQIPCTSKMYNTIGKIKHLRKVTQE